VNAAHRKVGSRAWRSLRLPELQTQAGTPLKVWVTTSSHLPTAAALSVPLSHLHLAEVFWC
jgi:hypothetical protein